MKQFRFLMILCCLTVAAPCQQWEQTSTPRVLNITTEFIKVSQESPHLKVESGWRKAFLRANCCTHWLGLSSQTGPSSAIFLTPYDSLQAAQKEAIEWLWKEQDALTLQDAAYVESMDHQIAMLEPEMSVPAKFPFGAARAIAITKFQVEPSQTKNFRQWLRTEVAAKTSVLPHLAAYRISAGGPLSTFLLIEARTSRGAFDSNWSNWDGAPGVKDISRNLYDATPEISYVSKEMAKGNESFWMFDQAK